MTELRKAAEMALEALDCLPWQASPIAREATQALRQALAQPEQEPVDMVKIEHDKQVELAQAYERGWNAALAHGQEPVAWMYVNDDGECEQIEYGEPFDDPSVTPLYTAPPKREWVGITKEDKKEILEITQPNERGYVIAITEAKLKAKNT